LQGPRRELGYSIWDHILKALEEEEEEEEQGTTTTVLRATAEDEDEDEEEQGTTNELLLIAARINLFESLRNGRATAADDD